MWCSTSTMTMFAAEAGRERQMLGVRHAVEPWRELNVGRDHVRKTLLEIADPAADLDRQRRAGTLRRCDRRNRRRRRAGPACAPRRADSPAARRSCTHMRLDAQEREEDHAQQHEAVAEARDLGLAIGAAGIADRHLDDLEAELRGAENQVEIAERIEVAEIAAAGLEPCIVGAAQRPWCRTACR